MRLMEIEASCGSGNEAHLSRAFRAALWLESERIPSRYFVVILSKRGAHRHVLFANDS
jgi:hypothetical protein